jgi:hypothetical protein
MAAGTLVMLAITWAYGEETTIGQIKKLVGAVQIVRNDVESPANLGDLVQEADMIATGADGSCGITFIDNSRFSIGPDSRIELKQFRFDSTTHEGAFLTKMQHGTLAVVSGHIAKHSSEAMKVETPSTLLGVRGTQFLVKIEK